MAQINVTLDQDEILRLLADSSGDAFRQVLAAALNAVMRAESDEQLGAGRYERSESRTDSRNGTRARRLTTRVGTIELEVPRHRNAPFETMVFESYRRSEAALVATMAEMVVGGVSTAKVGRVMRGICGRGLSKQSVPAACATLDSAVEGFRRLIARRGLRASFILSRFGLYARRERCVSRFLQIPPRDGRLRALLRAPLYEGVPATFVYQEDVMPGV